MLKDINLNELTVENMGVWPLQIKGLVIGICCLLLFAFGYWFDTRGQLAQLEARKREEGELLQQIAIKHQLVANFPAYKKQLEEMKKSFKVMLQQLPGTTEVPGLLEDISKAGVVSGLEFKSFKPLPEKKAEFYAELPIEISVIGNYHQLGQFVSKVSSLSRIVTLHDYTIENLPAVPGAQQKQLEKSAGGEKLVMSIIAKTYRYTDEQKAKAEKGNDNK